jgi:alpha-L-fucosidase
MDLVQKYHPDMLWLDGDWDGDDEHWRSRELLTWLYTQSPVKDTIVVNDRLGKGCMGKHGDVYNMHDRSVVASIGGHKKECVYSIGKSWGYNSHQRPTDFNTPMWILYSLLRTVCNGGNFVLNLGPKADGTLDETEVYTFYTVGSWLNRHHDAVFNAIHDERHYDAYVMYMKRGDVVYIIFNPELCGPPYAALPSTFIDLFNAHNMRILLPDKVVKNIDEVWDMKSDTWCCLKLSNGV